jgi:glycosyltransferase involved in cell wall biosynthesis
MSSMLHFTVAICTYNGEHRIGNVLASLQKQAVPDHIRYEILVIDNNSSDATKTVVSQYLSHWNSRHLLRYVFEPRQGVAFARQCAIEKAQSQLIGFLDDDNFPQPNWIMEAWSFADKHLQAGAFGSHVEGLFDQAPPEDFKKLACFLAIVDRGSKPFIYQPRGRLLPPAAGLVVRREAWLKHVPRELFLTGRVDNWMLGSEDLEALTYIQKAGWEIWHNPHMIIQHKIPRERLKKDYLMTLIRGTGLARNHIRMIRLKSWQRPPMTVLYFVNDLRKIILFYLNHGLELQHDLYLACKFQWLKSSLVSPWYLWKKHYLIRE